MNQNEKRHFLISELLKEHADYQKMRIPTQADEQKRLLRALMNVRLPDAVSQEFLKVQDDYLKGELSEKGIVKITDLEPLQKGIYLWQGDITRLATDAIVNAANSGMTGCYQPNHTCIDNCIHTFAGVQLRLECAELMEKQGHEEFTGQAKITSGYNLPCKYVLHTVGPIVQGELTTKHCNQLISCYQSCMELADKNNCRSIAFCCISTGVFCFPNKKAAEIAVRTVMDYGEKTNGDMEVVFNVFKDEDYEIYKSLLG
ncbi:MAG: protein-ADP-ribose hydrolase [Roseburia sp.]|nr:protein-ADP-ribose hydrolase [Roseburia sp.]MCM1279637.1 protein-ADP-ribose hydrolase [Robinsoniella sp.]